MDDSNTPAPAGTADAAPLSQADIEEQIGDAVEASEQEQASPQSTEPAAGETEEKSNDKAEPETAEEEAEPEKAEGTEPDDGVVIKMDDGTTVTLAELKRGHLRQSDYTRKTQEVSKEREQTKAERETLTKAGNQLKGYLDLAVTVLQESIPPAPDPQLINTDAISYLQQKEAHDRGIQRLQAATAAQSNIGQQSQQISQSEMAELRKREMAALTEKIPELAKPEAREQFLTTAAKYAEKIGVSAEEIGQILDHRHIAVLHAATKWWKLQDEKMAAVRKAKTAPPIQPAARQAPGTRESKAVQESIDRLKREGSREAFMDAITDQDLGL